LICQFSGKQEPEDDGSVNTFGRFQVVESWVSGVYCVLAGIDINTLAAGCTVNVDRHIKE
jgi:hypothetical protein